MDLHPFILSSGGDASGCKGAVRLYSLSGLVDAVPWIYSILTHSYKPFHQELQEVARRPKLERISAIEVCVGVVICWIMPVRSPVCNSSCACPPQDIVRRREASITFDPSRLVDFDERLVWRGPAVQLTPLVRGRD